MANQGQRGKFEREILGEPIVVAGRTVQPVARLTGWQGTAGEGRGGLAGVLVRIAPVEVRVREGDGSERSLPITDVTREALRGIFIAGLIVAGVGALIMLVARLKRA